MGFCFFSTAAIAALYARAQYRLRRVAVVDFDVHHGNGTQDIFWADADLFYGSTHQMPLFPGTGAASERGVGNVWNAPLRAGDGGEAFRGAFEGRILPALDRFGPDDLKTCVMAIFNPAVAPGHPERPSRRLLQQVRNTPPSPPSATLAWRTGRLGRRQPRSCRL